MISRPSPPPSPAVTACAVLRHARPHDRVARYGARPHQEAMARSFSGETFTVDAMEIGKTEGCDVVAVHGFSWTDASYAAIRQII
jgi:hypothetical protein